MGGNDDYVKPPKLGQEIGTYKVTGRLYAGHRSWVVTALHNGEVRVLKAYIKHLLPPQLAEKVARETALVGTLDHPHVVRCLEAWQDVSHVYISQEFCSRGDLTRVAELFPYKCVPEPIVSQKIIRPVLLALSYLHARGVIHRDIKPENIVIADSGDTKICDFGLAIDTNIHKTPVSRVGTLEFMAPEIARLARRPLEEKEWLRSHRVALYGPQVDVWSLGVTAFELVYGATPFAAIECEEEVMRQITDDQPLFLPTFTRALRRVSAHALTFLAGSLTRCPRSRPSAEELLKYEWVQLSAEDSPSTSAPAVEPQSTEPHASCATAGVQASGGAAASVEDSAPAEKAAVPGGRDGSRSPTSTLKFPGRLASTGGRSMESVSSSASGNSGAAPSADSRLQDCAAASETAEAAAPAGRQMQPGLSGERKSSAHGPGAGLHREADAAGGGAEASAAASADRTENAARAERRAAMTVSSSEANLQSSARAVVGAASQQAPGLLPSRRLSGPATAAADDCALPSPKPSMAPAPAARSSFTAARAPLQPRMKKFADNSRSCSVLPKDVSSEVVFAAAGAPSASSAGQAAFEPVQSLSALSVQLHVREGTTKRRDSIDDADDDVPMELGCAPRLIAARRSFHRAAEPSELRRIGSMPGPLRHPAEEGAPPLQHQGAAPAVLPASGFPPAPALSHDGESDGLVSFPPSDGDRSGRAGRWGQRVGGGFAPATPPTRQGGRGAAAPGRKSTGGASFMSKMGAAVASIFGSPSRPAGAAAEPSSRAMASSMPATASRSSPCL